MSCRKGDTMSRRKRAMERMKKEKKREQTRRTKTKVHDPYKWDKKKAQKQSKQANLWETKYHDANADCKLILSKFPSPENCSGCELPCKYRC